jgi:hypothetical protein
VSSFELERFKGGRNWLLGSAVGGVLLLVATFAGLAIDAQETMFSYLVAFAYWAGLGIASLVMLMIFHTFKAKWMVVFRRPLEVMGTSVILFLVLFIPIALNLKQLYLWVDPPASLGREALKVLAGKQAYLNTTAFVVRSMLYFVILAIVSMLLCQWSIKQDATGALDLTRKQRKLGAGGLPLIAMVFTFAAFDWLMSLNPLWFSTIFGVYYFAGNMGGAFALLAIITSRVRSPGGVQGKVLFGDYISVEHTHNIGKLMLTFTAFWGYIAFAQLLLIWIANLPEEVPFFITRFKPGWAWVGILLIVGHFFIPFGALLSRSLKRNRHQLAVVAVWMLFIHYVDIYWLVMPTLHPEGFQFHWTSLTAFGGIGLCAISFVVWRLRGNYTIPVKDPYLANSLRYREP